MAKEAANKVMKRFAERMNKAEAESKVMHIAHDDGCVFNLVM